MKRFSETAVRVRRAVCRVLTTRKPSRFFVFRGIAYPYCYDLYNDTFMNERTVEIPVAWAFVEAATAAGKRILEIGNTLSNYRPCQHDILDKYDEQPGIICEDVVDFRPPHSYDLIVSVSTLEHVGWDEGRDATKFARAVSNLKACLAPGGTLVVTVPLGYHPEIDRLFAAGKLPFSSLYYLERVSWSNRWRETTRPTLERYPFPFPRVRTVLIGISTLEQTRDRHSSSRTPS
jgi:SAM-dependent methyltransferase